MFDKVREVSVEEAGTIKILVEDEEDVTERNSRLLCKVSICASGGPTITADLMVDTGSGVSIPPMHQYKKCYSIIVTFHPKEKEKPKRKLITYSGTPITVLGCLESTVRCRTSCATKDTYVVSTIFWLWIFSVHCTWVLKMARLL